MGRPRPCRVGWVLTLRATLVLVVLVARCLGAGGTVSRHGRYRVGQAAPVLVLVVLIARHSALVAWPCTACCHHMEHGGCSGGAVVVVP